jgi:hypothetical protein
MRGCRPSYVASTLIRTLAHRSVAPITTRSVVGRATTIPRRCRRRRHHHRCRRSLRCLHHLRRRRRRRRRRHRCRATPFSTMASTFACRILPTARIASVPAASTHGAGALTSPCMAQYSTTYPPHASRCVRALTRTASFHNVVSRPTPLVIRRLASGRRCGLWRHTHWLATLHGSLPTRRGCVPAVCRLCASQLSQMLRLVCGA